jgi:hypothetical protein
MLEPVCADEETGIQLELPGDVDACLDQAGTCTSFQLAATVVGA